MNITHFEIAVGATTTAITGVIACIGFGYRYLVKPMKRVVRVVEIIEGEPAEIVNGFEVTPRRPGVIEWLKRHDDGQVHVIGQLNDLGQRMTVVEHELTPNSGGSLKDQVNTIAQVVTAQPGSTSS